jgi:sugar fermentation stimulation protein A
MVSFIEIGGKTVKGRFVKRYNRFLALIELNDEVVPCFLPNPGRMKELLVSGVEVLVREAAKKSRKTKFDLIGVMHQGELVSLDTMVPNRLVFEALKNKDIKEFNTYDFIKPEYGYGSSRFDFFLSNSNEKCLLEVKSCSLVKGGVALFPDAPTVRGKRHLLELIDAKKEGYRACVLFIVQRINVDVFAPNDETDPDFGEAFRKAIENGVEAYAYYSEFVGNRIFLKDKVLVKPKI